MWAAADTARSRCSVFRDPENAAGSTDTTAVSWCWSRHLKHCIANSLHGEVGSRETTRGTGVKDRHDQPELPTPAPHGATAVTAAITALILGPLTGIAGIMWALYMIVAIEDHAREYPAEIGRDTDLIVMGIIAVIIGLAWSVGGSLLLAYMKTGRFLLILASGLALIASVAQLFNRGFGFLFIPIIVSLLILILCAVPATGRWIVANEPEPNPRAHAQGRD
ncbi:hypothetical protein [Nocardia sp. NPDC051981]|uniref:hypothetical protein n=1 Tax=Nocardia sp. NPDC051981 TaxID=3155417 RepID=UPI00343C0649